MNFSYLIKQIRKEKLLSQDELAKILGVSFATVNRWENGHFNPSIKKQRSILKYCKSNKICQNFCYKEIED